jgi:hypothetical protein
VKTSALAATLCVSDGVVLVVVVVDVAVVVVTAFGGVVVAGCVVLAGRGFVATVEVAKLVEAGSGVIDADVVAGGAALGPVAIGSVGTGSATTFAEAIPPIPSTASEVSSRARRSTGAR